VSLSIRSDLFKLQHESLYLNLSNVSGGVLIDAQRRGTIVDDNPSSLPRDAVMASCQPK
jgi:hypothetical protein